ncbi:MAG: PIN domain-containing protein [Thermodesulfobacteriota bacterium]
MEFKSRNIFIDTQSFVKMGLNFHHPSLQAFCELCKKQSLNHLTTSVVTREVEGKITKAISDALNSLHEFRRKARLLQKIDDEKIKALFSEITEEEVLDKAINVYREFLKESKTKVLSADRVNPEVLLGLYFDRKPPFGDGKKKSEFPDAISLLAILDSLGEEIAYVISEDSDLEKFCSENEQLINIDTLDKFLDLYNEHESAITNLVKQHIADTTPAIKERILELISKAEAYNEAPWEDSKVEYFSATEVYDIEPYVVWVDEEECLVTFDVDVDVEYTVTGPNFNEGFYDREDGRMYVFENTSRTESTTMTFTVELGFFYEFDSGKLNNIKESEFYISGLTDGIAIYAENDSYY